MNYHPGTTDIKSQNNAFNWRTKPVGDKPSTLAEKAEATRTYNREYARKRYALKKAAERVNTFHPPFETQADRDRTARIKGRTNTARTQ